MAETEDPTETPVGDEEKPTTDLPAFGSSDFHNVVQKHILNAVYEMLVDNKMEWGLIAPFLDSARDICRADFQESAQIRLHPQTADGGNRVDAEEAFLGISVADRDNGSEWLSETYWLSDLVIAEEDPAQVRSIVAALERSIAKIELWLAEEKGGAATAAPPSELLICTANCRRR